MTLQASHNSVNKAVQDAAVIPSIDQAILIVTVGAQSGARMNIVIGRTYSIGVDETSEIVLRGAASDSSTMQITLTTEGVDVTRGQEAATNAAYHDELSFGAARFFVVKNNEPASVVVASPNNAVHAESFNRFDVAESGNVDAANADAANADAVNGLVLEQAHSESPANQNINLEEPSKHGRVKKHNRFLRPVLYASAIVVIGIAAFATKLWQDGSLMSPAVAVIPVEPNLADAGFGYLTVNRSTGTAVVSGYVTSRQKALDLAQVISEQREVVVNRVLVDAEIKDQIKDVLRVNGVPGIVESMGDGAFVANTLLPSGAMLDGLQSMIETDVPSVASFRVNNQIPELAFVEPENDSVQMDDGKRVVLVNSDEPVYVVTADQSRYFIGSILPGGYRITNILNGRVLLDKQGETTELKF